MCKEGCLSGMPNQDTFKVEVMNRVDCRFLCPIP